MKQNKHMRSIYTPFHLSKLKMKLFGFPLKGSGSISISEDTPCVDDGGGKKFKCRYCRRQFANSQALGGHQNAHRRERAKLAQFKYLLRLQQHDQYHHHRFNQASNASPSVSDASATTSAAALFQFHSAAAAGSSHLGTLLLQVPAGGNDVDLNLRLACSSENLKN